EPVAIGLAVGLARHHVRACMAVADRPDAHDVLIGGVADAFPRLDHRRGQRQYPSTRDQRDPRGAHSISPRSILAILARWNSTSRWLCSISSRFRRRPKNHWMPRPTIATRMPT